MATPRNDSYTAASGATVYAGMAAPAGLPTYLAGKAVGELVLVPNSSGAAGARLDAFSDVARVGTRLISAVAGGHGDGYENQVTGIDLAANSPGWSVLRAASSSVAANVAYYPDGTPSSRHTYHIIHGDDARNSVWLPGLRASTYNGANTYYKVDRFDLSGSALSGDWAGVVPGSPGTSGSGFTDMPAGYSFPVVRDPTTGDLWGFDITTGTPSKYSPTGNAWTQPAQTIKVTGNARAPWAWDSLRGQFFGLCIGDGEDSASGTTVKAVVCDKTTQWQITLTGSGLAQFQADAGRYAGMCYDPDNDRFLWLANAYNRIYAIQPNGTTTWTITQLSPTGATLPTGEGGGVMAKVHYIPALKAVAFMLQKAAGIYIMRTA